MRRDRAPELMDQPTLDRKQHAHALRSLNRVNRWLGVDRGFLRGARSMGHAGGSCLDLGAGGGGLLGYLSRRFDGTARPLFLGLDRSVIALGWAREWQPDRIRWVAADALHIPLRDNSIDVVTCSLFLHHFDEPGVVRILCEAARVARRGIVVGDLSRSRLALMLTWIATRIASRSEVFHVDGVRSVRAAFCPRELAHLAELAGLSGARIEKRFPFRLLMVWRKRADDRVNHASM